MKRREAILPKAITDEYLKEIECARCDLKDLIIAKNCAPIMLRLAFHDAGNYDAKTKTGGANGSIRFPEELSKPANNGIQIAVNFCEEIKKKHPIVTYADLYQLAGVIAVEVTGGPKIDFVPGRVDALIPDTVELPNPTGDAAHLRAIFYRMGFSDKDIVAISGSHTLGKAHPERSGFDGPLTIDPFSFNNSYYRELLQGNPEGVIKFPTDKVLVEDKEFKKYVQRYAESETTFYKEYAESHKKMSELGFQVGAPKCGCH